MPRDGTLEATARGQHLILMQQVTAVQQVGGLGNTSAAGREQVDELQVDGPVVEEAQQTTSHLTRGGRDTSKDFCEPGKHVQRIKNSVRNSMTSLITGNRWQNRVHQEQKSSYYK